MKVFPICKELLCQMENEIKESRWSKFVSSFEDYKYSSFGDIDEYYLTPQERTNMFKKATEDLKLKVKALRGQSKSNKKQTKQNG